MQPLCSADAKTKILGLVSLAKIRHQLSKLTRPNKTQNFNDGCTTTRQPVDRIFRSSELYYFPYLCSFIVPCVCIRFVCLYQMLNLILQPIWPVQEHSYFRPISTTPGLSRTFERVIVRQFIYPAILEHPVHLSCTDQYAFPPAGSTTAALVAILQSVTELLSCNSYVVVITLDIGKASDTVRHSTMLHKMASINIPYDGYNWLVDFFSGHSHCTVSRGSTSGQLDISASVIRGNGGQCSRSHHSYCWKFDVQVPGMPTIHTP